MTSFYVSDDIITCACSHMCVLAYSTVWCHIPPTQTNAIFTAQKNAYHLSLTIFTAIFQLEISVYSYFLNKYLPDRVKKYEQKKRDSCFLNVTLWCKQFARVELLHDSLIYYFTGKKNDFNNVFCIDSDQSFSNIKALSGLLMF